MVAIVIVSRIHVDCYCDMVVNDSDGGKRHGRNGGNRSGTCHGVSCLLLLLWHGGDASMVVTDQAHGTG